ncbi:MAG: hypothetical protein PHC54_05395 [Candidatus Omnitrophica bacterium]|nr:hypothetical protein [Candidatus Omnitrophota bacterium]MDD5592665.1 hypothetical protein [Candidatus Omnitrophota bacterium]
MSDKEELRDILNEIGKHAVRLHDLMKEGTAIDITFVKEEKLLIPNQPSKVSHLLLVKPVVYAEVKLKPKLADGNTN